MSAKNKRKLHKICDVVISSIADELGIEPGSFLVSVNDKNINDFFDYESLVSEQDLKLEIIDALDQTTIYEIEKDEQEDVGLIFEDYLMDEQASCKNKCVFCFVDQLPKNLRKTLYFKDDDLRLSFLSGNYVTLTNTSYEELDRLIGYKLSPMNISVHATDPEVRTTMMKNPKAGQIMNQLRKIANANIDINTQVVLCPGYNDGKVLEQTIKDIDSIGQQIKSIAIVPVGLTKHRTNKNLSPISPMTAENAKVAIDTVNRWQKQFLKTRNQRLIFAADEMYIKANMQFPKVEEYEDFPQLENGVGMSSLFIQEMQEGLNKRTNETNTKTKDSVAIIVTGVDAGDILSGFEDELSKAYKTNFIVKPITNYFFGETVTVAGLVTAGDIIKSLSEDSDLDSANIIFIPQCMLKSDMDIFLDDLTIDDLKSKLENDVLVVPTDASGFLAILDENFGRRK